MASVKIFGSTIVRRRYATRVGPWRRLTARRRSEADRTFKRLASRHDLAPVIVAAMAANVVRPLQLAAVAALRVGLRDQRLVRTPHPPPRGRGFLLRNSHGTTPLQTDTPRTVPDFHGRVETRSHDGYDARAAQ